MAAALAVGLLAVTTGSRGLRADHTAHDAVRHQDDEALQTVVARFERAVALHPFAPEYHGLAATYLRSRSLRAPTEGDRRLRLDDAAAHLRRMVDLQPGYHLWLLELARTTGYLAAMDPSLAPETEATLRAAREASPVDWRIPLAAGEIHQLWGRTADTPTVRRERLCRSLDDYRSALRLRPWAKSAWIGLANSLRDLGRGDEAASVLERALTIPEEQERNAEIQRLLDDLEGDAERPARSCDA